jgi:hypothetical protein
MGDTVIWLGNMAGHGKKFDFHGSFSSKATAIKKEQEVSGFIREKIIDGKTRYFVLTERK